MNLKHTNQHLDRQRGAALVVGLIFLAMLSLLGVAAYMVANQEERMAGNTRDRIRAFEAAEASLRDCESLLGGLGALPKFDGTQKGMYVGKGYGRQQVYETIDWLDDNKVRIIPTALPDVAIQPRCIIEKVEILQVRRLSDERSGPKAYSEETAYRVTAMGYGTSQSTAVNLQTIFRDE